MQRFGLAAFLVLTFLVGAVGVVAYNLGVSAGAADAAIAEGASVIYAPGAGISPFSLIVGLVLVILIIGLIARVVAGPRMPMGGRAWGHHWAGYRGRGPGGWEGTTIPEPFRPMLERWHREAHGGADAATGPHEMGVGSVSGGSGPSGPAPGGPAPGGPAPGGPTPGGPAPGGPAPGGPASGGPGRGGVDARPGARPSSGPPRQPSAGPGGPSLG